MSNLLTKIKIKFLKRRNRLHPHDRIDTLSKNIQQSFFNLRKDMEHISKLLHYYDKKHKDHDNQFSLLIKKINYLEAALQELSTEHPEYKKEIKQIIATEEAISNTKDEQVQVDSEYSGLLTESLWDNLTETQQKLCWKLAALQKEMPKQWISLKYLAQELYPDKDYASIRSTLSQFIANLEELGLVKRKRKGKQAYVISTNKNPCLNKLKQQILIEKKYTKKKKK